MKMPSFDICLWIYKKYCKAVTVTDFVFTYDKLCIKFYTMNLDARDISYEI